MYSYRQANRHRVSPKLYQVAQLCTDSVPCRESASTEPVVLKLVPVTVAAFLGITMNHSMCASLFPQDPLYLYIDSGYDV